jgi:predicted component of type VI protein secretion system
MNRPEFDAVGTTCCAQCSGLAATGPTDTCLLVSTVAGTELVPVAGDRVVIGRSAAADLVLTGDRRVSRVHAVLERVGHVWTLRDLGSRNGTFYNGVRVADRVRVGSGDEILVGDSTLALRVPPSEDAEVTEAKDPAPLLTPREHDVLVALLATISPGAAFGAPGTTRQIASALQVSDAAVQSHLENLYRKFGVEPGPDRRLRLANAAVATGALAGR